MISIITVTRNDAWKLSKTLRNVFLQDSDDYEHIVMDGMSTDGTAELCSFWTSVNPRFKAIRQSDESLYDAMNQGVAAASGDYVCFLNSGDVFLDDQVLSRVADRLRQCGADGLIGWGTWRGEYWASWGASRSLFMSSNGFCHQALFLKKSWLERFPFTLRRGKTDSDTEQLARVSIAGGRIDVMPELLAERFPDLGISAWQDENSSDCVLDTISENYPELSEDQIAGILAFRRRCERPELLLTFLASPDISREARCDIACLALDTLFLPRGRFVELPVARRLASTSSRVLEHDVEGAGLLQDFITQKRNLHALAVQKRKEAKEKQSRNAAFVTRFEAVLDKRSSELEEVAPDKARDTPVVALTSFPARIRTLHVVLKSLLSQSLKPKKIVVTLGLDEFSSPEWLPRQLRDLEGHGVEILWVESTRNQYDKFMDLPPDLLATERLIIVDDDLIYPASTIEALVEDSDRHPDCVVANRCHRMRFDLGGDLEPYETWDKEVWQDSPSFDLFPTGAGGVLYPVGFFDSDVLDELAILGTAPYADDIWLKRLALKKGLRTLVTDLTRKGRWYIEYIPNMLESSLYQSNVLKGLNDYQMRRLGEEVAAAKVNMAEAHE